MNRRGLLASIAFAGSDFTLYEMENIYLDRHYRTGTGTLQVVRNGTAAIVMFLMFSSFASANDNLIAMAYNGPTLAEVDGTLELHDDVLRVLQKDVKSLSERVAQIEARLASASKPGCDCGADCKCENCPADCIKIPVITLPEPEAEQRQASTRLVTLHGKPVDVDEYIARNNGYGGQRWDIANSGNINAVWEHLRYHGWAGFEGLSKNVLMALHQATHHAHEPVRATRTTSSQKNASQSVSRRSSGCANGNCSRPARRGLLGRWR